jgi:outer membrane protein
MYAPIYDGATVIKTALEINPDVKLAETRQLAAQQGIKVAMGAYYPTLVLFGSGNSRYSDASIRFDNPTANYPFFDQFKDNFNQSIGLIATDTYLQPFRNPYIGT